jgi:tetratricopeptide (TPR) repeat protein
MYLPLAAVIVAVVTGACVLGDSLSSRLPSPAASRRTLARLGLVMAACVVAILGWRTARRNVDYQSVVGMWQDVVAKRPSNDRARCNLGFALRAVGRTAEAIAEYQEALRWKPDCVEAHYNVANALLYLGRPEEAIPHYEATIRLMTSPAKLAEAYNNLGVALAKTGKPDRAILCYQQALKLNPDFAAARKNLESSQRSTTVPGD